jgi:acyl-CoA synthetase (AMP-forming)/AMP-acid ligase II
VCNPCCQRSTECTRFHDDGCARGRFVPSVQPGFATEADFAAAGQGVSDRDLTVRRQLVKVRDPAVVMYTSGTAAEPKGALLTHEALTRFAADTRETRFFLTPEDRIWTALPMFHIGGIAFSVAIIYAGATLCHTGFFRPEGGLPAPPRSLPLRSGCAFMPPERRAVQLMLIMKIGLLPDALKPGFHGVRTHCIRGFMAFRLVWRIRTVVLM